MILLSISFIHPVTISVRTWIAVSDTSLEILSSPAGGQDWCPRVSNREEKPLETEESADSRPHTSGVLHKHSSASRTSAALPPPGGVDRSM